MLIHDLLNKTWILCLCKLHNKKPVNDSARFLLYYLKIIFLLQLLWFIAFLHRIGLIIMSSLKTMATVVGWVHSGPKIASCVLWPWAWVILLLCKDDKYSSILVPLHNNAPLLIFILLNCDNLDSVTTQASSLMELFNRHPAVRLLFMTPMWNESCLLIRIIIY